MNSTSMAAAAQPAERPPGSAQASRAELAVPIAVLGIVLALITPLPALVLDFLLVIDIMTSVIVMMVAMYIRKPADFSVFPTTLLLLTLSRLALNISASRLILLNGNMGTSAAGHVIEAFGTFVVGGNYVIGAVIFLALIAIQYVVINHGAVRISEVTARFTLDALPGKQMSIDADLNAGLITESEARTRRKQLAAEAEFYGAMDGASRFTQRDAIASILITGINIIAGFLIGVLQHGMELRRAAETYTVLTIGEGLVTVIPALMISISGGLIVTRSSSDNRLGVEVHNQLLRNPQPLFLASGVLVTLGMFPGLPALPFFALGGALGVFAYRLRRNAEKGVEAPSLRQAAPAESLESLTKVDPMVVEVGLGLLPHLEGGSDSPLLQRITALRRQVAAQLGFLIPPLKVRDNLQLRSMEYRVLLRGAEIARYELMADKLLAIPSAAAEPLPDAIPTHDPSFGLAAFWIPSSSANKVRLAGYVVVDAVSTLGAHLAELIRTHSHEIFGRQDAKQYCDRVAQEHPKTVEDLVPKLLSLATIQKVLQNLLRERVSIRDGALVLEALGEAATLTRNSILLGEYVRQSLRRTLIQPYLNAPGELSAWLLTPELESLIDKAVEHGEQTSHLHLAPVVLRQIVDSIRTTVGASDASPVILCSTGARFYLRQIIEPVLPGSVALSHNEIPPETKVRALGQITLPTRFLA